MSTEVSTTLRSAYLAGPMRGIPKYNFPEFYRQAAWLRGKGWEVFSPAERDDADPQIDSEKDNAGWADKLGLDYFMKFDLAAVCSTDCVVLLNGWETSQGARLEAMVAVEVGHPVFEIVWRPWTLGERMLASVSNAHVAAEFIAGTKAYDQLPTLEVARQEDREHDTSQDGQCWCDPEVVTITDQGIISSAEEFDPPVLRVTKDKLRTFLGPMEDGDYHEVPPFENRNDDINPLWEEGAQAGADALAMRQFGTGATRNVESDPDIHGFTSPLAIAMFARYMHENRTQADGTIRDSDNWKRGIPIDSYIRSMRRHLQDLTLHHDGYADCSREDLYAALGGLFFNVQGYMHEVSKADIAQEREEEQEEALLMAISLAVAEAEARLEGLA